MAKKTADVIRTKILSKRGQEIEVIGLFNKVFNADISENNSRRLRARSLLNQCTEIGIEISDVFSYIKETRFDLTKNSTQPPPFGLICSATFIQEDARLAILNSPKIRLRNNTIDKTSPVYDSETERKFRETFIGKLISRIPETFKQPPILNIPIEGSRQFFALRCVLFAALEATDIKEDEEANLPLDVQIYLSLVSDLSLEHLENMGLPIRILNFKTSGLTEDGLNFIEFVRSRMRRAYPDRFRFTLTEIDWKSRIKFLLPENIDSNPFLTG